MRVCVFGARGKVGSVLVPGLETEGHAVLDTPEGADATIDFTAPEAVVGNVRRSLASGVPVVIGTTGFDLAEVDGLARAARLPCFHAANFALGAVLMMRFAEEAARAFPDAEIVELHAATKRDAPSGTAKATAARMGTEPRIHSVRLPGLVAHQEVIFGGTGQTLVLRSDTIGRDSYMPGVMLAVHEVMKRDGLVIGLDSLIGLD